MIRKLSTLAAFAVLSGCTFEPAYDVTCTDEGAVSGDKTCRGGVWIAGVRPGVDAGPDAGIDACVPESDIDLCNRMEANCGVAEFVDNCGTPRGVNCGVCAGGSECGTEQPNVCFCPGESTADLCAAQQACGILTVADQCGNTVPIDCGGCDGVASCAQNSCTCDVAMACDSLGAKCGTVDVAGMCAGANEINCGSCGDLAFCTDQNVCECERGYSGDGITCEDVDECAIGTHDCDPNADCMNLTPGYDCECRAGFEGDGKSCTSNVRVVTAVRNVLINMDNPVATGTYAAIDRQNAVPFMTQYLRDTGEEGDRIAVDVTFTADDQVQLEREDGLGSVVAAVSVVEFDPAHVRVQSGSFSFNDGAETTTLDRSVDPSKSFVVFYFRRDNNSDERRDLFVTAEFQNNGSELRFEREDTSGNVRGHYWVVESRGTAFDVQHETGDLLGSPAVNIPISTVDPGKSMVLFSSRNTAGNTAGGRSNVRCGLAATNVKCERASSNDDAFAHVQVVSFSTDVSVQRGERAFNSGDGEMFIQISNVDQSSTAFGGSIGLAGVQEQAASGESPGGFFTSTVMPGGNEVKLQRGDPRTTEARVSWQVIDW